MNKNNLPRVSRMHKRSPLRKQLAFTMIEVLISVVILSVGLLGLAGLQVVGIKGTQHASMKMQATLATHNLLEKIRANSNGDYTQIVDCKSPLPKNCGLASTDCSLVDDIAAYDLYLAQCGRPIGGKSLKHAGGISQLLTNGQIQVSCPSGCISGVVRVSVSWDERVIDENQRSGAVGQVISKRMELDASVK